MFDRKLREWIRSEISRLEKEIADIKKNLDPMEVEKIKTNIVSLRGLVNRKLGGSQEEPDPMNPKSYKEVFLGE
jgi:hypothetical protein